MPSKNKTTSVVESVKEFINIYVVRYYNDFLEMMCIAAIKYIQKHYQ